ncbi:MAG: vapB [Myxococcales bacterium]|nr:vapB [Myxococcales bacterium]
MVYTMIPIMRSKRPAKQVAKVFWTGRSQAVRLPKEFRFTGDTVVIRRDGAKVILEPDNDWPEGWLGSWDTPTEDFIRHPQGKLRKVPKF